MVLDDLLKELIVKHDEYSHIFGHNIPSSFLTFSASQFLDVIGKERSSRSAYENFDNINTADVLYRDFVDPTGEDEMSKLLRRIL